MRRIAEFLSACSTVGWGVLLIYLLVRSRLNGIGWVSLGEPNDLIFCIEVLVLFPALIACGLITLAGLKR